MYSKTEKLEKVPGEMVKTRFGFIISEEMRQFQCEPLSIAAGLMIVCLAFTCCPVSSGLIPLSAEDR
jgi:hypothetical protein